MTSCVTEITGERYFLSGQSRTSATGVLDSTRDLFRVLFLVAVFLLGSLFFGSNALAQQTGTIVGTVTDSTTEGPLPGVNVIVVDTEQGGTTDGQGNYRISNVEVGTHTLRASFVGFTTKTRGVEVEAGETTTVNFTLVPSEVELQEMVVTALGVEREERSLSYSTQEMGTAEVAEAQELNLANSMAGRISGMRVNQAATGVGGATRVIIRGNRSISGSSQPLWVIDGVPTRGGPSNLNPNDIEDINVLKGPSAAALYGSEAQNGAIVVTTKSGQEGELQLSFSQNVQARDPLLLTDYQNQYGQGSNGQYSASSEISWGPRMNGQTVDHWSQDPEDADRQYSYNPQPNNVSDFFQMGYNSSTNLAASFGTESTQARFSYGFTTSEGIIPENALERHNVTARFSSEVSEKLSFNGKVQYSNQTIDNQLQTGERPQNPLRQILRMPRNIRTEDAKEFEYFTDEGLRLQNYWNPGSTASGNPYWVINRNLNSNVVERVIALTSLTYNFTDALSLMVRGSYDGSNNRSETKWYVDTYNIADNGQYSLSRNNSWEGNGEFLLQYTDDLFEDWSVDASLGGNLKKERGGALSANTGNALTVPNFFTITNTQNVNAGQSVGSPREVHSLYGRTQIGWNDAVFLDVTGRNDWSSTLPPGNRSFFYPSVGLSAVISDLVSLPDFWSYAQLRGSWAQVGNSAPPFQTKRTANFSSGGNNGFLQLSSVLPASDLVPEETTSYEFGLDTRFFGERLGLDVALYQTNSRNQLFTSELPVGSGAAQAFVNGGDVQNKGVEVTLSGSPLLTQDFELRGELQFSKNQSEVVKLREDQPQLTIAQDFLREFRIEAGEPFGQIYSRGFVRDDQGRVIVGENGVPEITDGLSVQIADYNADWNGSFRGSVSYKSAELSFLIDHRQGGSTASITNAILDAHGVRERTLIGRREGEDGLVFGEDIFTDETAVQEDGSPNDVSVDPETLWRNLGGRNAPAGEAFVVDATNTRLRELRLGYSLPQSLVGGLPFSSARLSLVGRNLFFIHRASSNIDPDILVGTNAAAEGFESFTPPTTRTFGFNLQIQY